MDLILWRHAQAVEREHAAADDERELTDKGRKHAKRMAAWLRKRLPDDYILLVSPATRAQQTAAALTPDFRTTRSIGPRASGKQLLAAARWPAGAGTVVLVGHQPALGAAAALALARHADEWTIRKGAVWWLRTVEADANPVLLAVMDPRLL